MTGIAQQGSGATQQAFPPAPARFLQFDIHQELEVLRGKVRRQEGAWKKGIARDPLVDYPDLRASLIYLEPGAQIEEHYNPGRIIVHTVAGHIRMHAAGKSFDLPLGAVLVLDRAVEHDVEALEESVFLLTVVPPGR